MTKFFLCNYLCLLIVLCYAQTNNFLGGSISWQPVSPYLTNAATVTIALQQTYSWVNSAWGCLALSGSLSETLVCLTGCSSNTTNIFVKGPCVYYDFGLDVTTARSVQTLSYALRAQLVLAYQNSTWKTLVSGATTWSVATYINLAVRNDTGVINSSPTANMTPIVVVPVNTQQTLRIPMTDGDYDVVKCRWASSTSAVASTTIDECKGVCQDLPGAKLHSSSNTDNNCTIVFNTSVVGYYCIAIQIEDFMSSSPNGTALSSIPLQFLVRSVQVSCGIPIITGDPTNGDTIYVQYNITYSAVITAQSGCSSTTIVRFLTIILPSGLASISTLFQSSSILYSTILKWTPTIDQIGTKQLFCTFAIDSNNSLSTEYCLNFVVIAQITASNSNNDSINWYLILGVSLGIGLPLCILMNILSYFNFPRWFNKKLLDKLRSKLSSKDKTLSRLHENPASNGQKRIDNGTQLYRELYIQPDDSMSESLSRTMSTSSISLRASHSLARSAKIFLSTASMGTIKTSQSFNNSVLPEGISTGQESGSHLFKAYLQQNKNE
ncbi:unnamed protein product [Rotaria magnacalcarata]|uniref:Uncharacterized protein n=1 Tax=Rotaria magnacalcarata TaxID=392030 RepID=A0A816V1J7_9BILA|nr:unnamed protein product [Rotaria magnacalcarata]